MIFEGVKDGRYTSEKSSEEAARGKLEVLKDFVRGATAIAKSKEAKVLLEAITVEIDRLHPKEDQ